MKMDRIKTYSNALWALHLAGLLENRECKNPIKSFIRQSSECNNYHCYTHYRSREVESQLHGLNFKSQAEYHKYCSSNFAHEHMVPVEALYQLIIKSPQSSDNIESLLRRFSKRATITKEQNKLLSKSSMPDYFYHSLNNPDSHLARYVDAGIVDNLVLRTTTSWI
ncbi:hypothetical protein [Plesiomonas shigelloides]|uniref:hypothetical protein n=1 Tax=Plesiomonas shigelloides TaxID=703 RepID=UPI001261BB61|nr:hypothetical protein [Plesiomonas shigelloides]KAB7690884.1 hypothetical protein GBN20_04940 [Plesiomonas shigelloides]